LETYLFFDEISNEKVTRLNKKLEDQFFDFFISSSRKEKAKINKKDLAEARDLLEQKIESHELKHKLLNKIAFATPTVDLNKKVEKELMNTYKKLDKRTNINDKKILAQIFFDKNKLLKLWSQKDLSASEKVAYCLGIMDNYPVSLANR
jgi:hypothetical protein